MKAKTIQQLNALAKEYEPVDYLDPEVLAEALDDETLTYLQNAAIEARILKAR